MLLFDEYLIFFILFISILVLHSVRYLQTKQGFPPVRSIAPCIDFRNERHNSSIFGEALEPNNEGGGRRSSYEGVIHGKDDLQTSACHREEYQSESESQQAAQKEKRTGMDCY